MNLITMPYKRMDWIECSQFSKYPSLFLLLTCLPTLYLDVIHVDIVCMVCI